MPGDDNKSTIAVTWYHTPETKKENEQQQNELNKTCGTTRRKRKRTLTIFYKKMGENTKFGKKNSADSISTAY
jgi:hypothetical protein